MTTASHWIATDETPAICRGEVHLWRIALDPSDEVVAALHSVLCPDERKRAAKFRVARVASRFIVGRASLRKILAGYGGIEASAIHFAHNAHGKPRLASHDPTATSDSVCFNLTHSGDLAVLAVSVTGEVGVDVEELRPRESAERLVRRFFAPGEQHTFHGLPEAERPMAFFQLWTRKEAYIKAVGQGLAIPLREFEVSLSESEHRVPIRSERRQDEAADACWIRPFDPGPGYVGAVATDTPDCALSFWQCGDGFG